MLCSSSVISHGVEWTAGLLAWLTFWHPQRHRFLSGTSRETAGLYELVTSFVLFLLHGRWNPHQIRQRCRKRKNVNWSEFWIWGGGDERKSFARICKWNAAACQFWPPPVLRLGRWSASLWRWKSSVSFVTICFDLKRGWGGNSTFYSVWLNVELIFNIWHFTQIIRPKTWPWGIFADCFFSTSATVELLFLKKAFELDEVITSDGCGHPDLEQLRESDIMIVEPR